MTDTSRTGVTVGVILAIIGCILQAIGFIIQKIAHNKLEKINQDLPEDKHVSYLKSPIWIVGFIVNAVLGTAFNCIALKYAPQSLVLPLSATTLVFNSILAIVILHEPFHKYDAIGTGLVVIGTVLTVIFGPATKEHNITIEYLIERWQDPGFFVFFILLLLLYVSDYIYVAVLEYQIKEHNEGITENNIKSSKKDVINYPQNAGIIRRLSRTIKQEELNELKTVAGITGLKHFSDYNSFLISYASLSGYCASNSFLFFKSTIEIVFSAARDKNDAHNVFAGPHSWYTYIMIILLIIVNILLVYFQQRALSAFNSLYVIPIFQVNVIVIGTALGASFFDELRGLKVYEYILFCLSICITIIGIIVLTFAPKQKDPETAILQNKNVSHKISRKITRNDDDKANYSQHLLELTESNEVSNDKQNNSDQLIIVDNDLN